MRHLLCSKWIFVPVVLVGLAGCSGSSTPTVTGTVTMDGKPLADGEVQFTPAEDKPGLAPATARTDAEGKFSIAPYQGNYGLKPGNYFVRVFKWVDRKGKAPDPEDLEQLRLARQLRNIIPRRYNDPESNPPFTAEVSASNTSFKFDVRSR